jgi:hypothetical protein
MRVAATDYLDGTRTRRLVTFTTIFVSLAVLLGCEDSDSGRHARPAALAVDRTPSGFSSLLSPPGKQKWPEHNELSHGAKVRVAARSQMGIVQTAVDALVAYFDRPNPAALNYMQAVADARVGRKVLLNRKEVVDIAAKRDSIIRARFAPSVVNPTLDALHVNDLKLQQHEPGYLSLGGGLTRVMVSRVDTGGGEALVGLFADVWTADVQVEADGALGIPTVHGDTVYYELLLAPEGGRPVVTDLQTWPTDSSAYVSAASPRPKLCRWTRSPDRVTSRRARRTRCPLDR